MLFWNKKANDQVCLICVAFRWQEEENTFDDGVFISIRKKKKQPQKFLRWFPLKLRLQRLFMYSKTVSLMWSHYDRWIDDGYLRNHADSIAWKEFDNRYKDFSKEPRNVRLSLASDGFNPFRTMSISHSTWLVILSIYNLTSWGLDLMQHVQ